MIFWTNFWNFHIRLSIVLSYTPRLFRTVGALVVWNIFIHSLSKMLYYTAAFLPAAGVCSSWLHSTLFRGSALVRFFFDVMVNTTDRRLRKSTTGTITMKSVLYTRGIQFTSCFQGDMLGSENGEKLFKFLPINGTPSGDS